MIKLSISNRSERWNIVFYVEKKYRQVKYRERERSFDSDNNRFVVVDFQMVTSCSLVVLEVVVIPGDLAPEDKGSMGE